MILYGSTLAIGSIEKHNRGWGVTVYWISTIQNAEQVPMEDLLQSTIPYNIMIGPNNPEPGYTIYTAYPGTITTRQHTRAGLLIAGAVTSAARCLKSLLSARLTTASKSTSGPCSP